MESWEEVAKSMQTDDCFGTRENLSLDSGSVEIFSLKRLDDQIPGDVFSLPFSVRVMLESLLRGCGGKFVSEEDVEALASWPESVGEELAYLPARVVMQDFTGVPAASTSAKPQRRTIARVPATSPFSKRWRRLYSCSPSVPEPGYLSPLCPSAECATGLAAEAEAIASESVCRNARLVVMTADITRAPY